MFDSRARDHLISRVIAAPLAVYPFPHIVIENVFPPAIYREISERYRALEGFVTLQSLGRAGKKYSLDRTVIELSVSELSALGAALLYKFAVPVTRFRQDFLAVRDASGFALGPHTDTIKKLATMIFYLPQEYDTRTVTLGTSVYVPRDPAFTSDGGKHFPLPDFVRVKRVPYQPNTLFAFARTDNSFHGVEPAPGSTAIARELLIYDLKADSAPLMPQDFAVR